MVEHDQQTLNCLSAAQVCHGKMPTLTWSYEQPRGKREPIEIEAITAVRLTLHTPTPQHASIATSFRICFSRDSSATSRVSLVFSRFSSRVDFGKANREILPSENRR
jgi:hypothetical protein